MKRNWFARHPIGFMALYFLLYLSAFNFLETQMYDPGTGCVYENREEFPIGADPFYDLAVHLSRIFSESIEEGRDHE